MPSLSLKGFIQTVIVVIVGFGIAFQILTGKPKPEPTALAEPPPIPVQTVVASPQSERLWITTQGTVEPTIATRLSAEVSGQVLEVSNNFVEGGFFRKGDILLEVQATQYQLALARAQSQLAAAEQRLAEEQGRALQAKREWRDLGSESANALFLREPQLSAAKASLEAAKFEVQKAEQDLDKTRIRAPFDGRVRQKLADLGQYIGVGMSVADVYSTDQMRVKLPLTDRQLSLIDVGVLESDLMAPEPVTIAAQVAGASWEWSGQLIGTSADVDTRSRVHYAIVTVSDPFGLTDDAEQPPLTPGLFVSARIQGKMINNVTRLPREAVRTDGTIRWVDQQQLVQERPVQLLHSDGREAWVNNLPQGLEVVVSMPSTVLLGTRVIAQRAPVLVARGAQ
ncbi:MAG: efflux RND transporter periplasmic adaptor subunit [Proteobacteria bacterium]|nr:efflux RND transporter periplasmic adaptor subunit [Pseudomonadota bacterium]